MSFSRVLNPPALRAAIRPQARVLTQRVSALRTTAANMSSITDAITKDHREIEDYYDKVVNAPNHDEQQRFGNQFTWELARHSHAEELLVYPAFEKYIGPKGKEMADKDRKEHHTVTSALLRRKHVTLTYTGQRGSEGFSEYEGF
jgi:hypothetical protein